MRNIRIVLALLATAFFTQSIFADAMDMSSESKECTAIVKACLKAGYTRKVSVKKQFWQDCMKPIILGQTVKGVNIDADTAKTCRANKIDEMKKQLDEFQKAS